MGNMQRRMIFALSLSVLLIASATVFRFSRTKASYGSLSVVNSDTKSAEIPSVTSVADTSTQGSVVSQAPSNLTSTDLVGRQLVSDYLGMSAKGQATDASVSTLVSRYASNLSTFNSFKPFTIAEAKTVPTTPESLKKYGDSVSSIYGKYHTLAGKTIATAGDLGSVGSKKFDTTMVTLGGLYGSAATELQAISVPDSMTEDELRLINNLISSANALKAIGDVNKDAATAYSALNAQATNDAELSDIFQSIQKNLLASGILFNAQI